MLLLESNDQRRHDVALVLRAAGLPLTAVARIADIERWPVGEMVVVDAAHHTGWWRTVGASYVLVQVENPEEGEAVCARGATDWILRSEAPDAVLSRLIAVSARIAV